jgi:hypothetical protein
MSDELVKLEKKANKSETDKNTVIKNTKNIEKLKLL